MIAIPVEKEMDSTSAMLSVWNRDEQDLKQNGRDWLWARQSKESFMSKAIKALKLTEINLI